MLAARAKSEEKILSHHKTLGDAKATALATAGAPHQASVSLFGLFSLIPWVGPLANMAANGTASSANLHVKRSFEKEKAVTL